MNGNHDPAYVNAILLRTAFKVNDTSTCGLSQSAACTKPP